MNRSGPPLGLLGALPLMIVVECIVAGQGLRTMTPDQAIMRRTVQNAAESAPGRDFLVFGDSLAKLGVAPRQIEAESGLRGYNLAVSGTQASNSYYMLKRALDAGARPKFVVVDFFPPLQRLPLTHVVENDPFQLRPGEAVELAVAARDPSLLASLLARTVLPSVARRQAIRTVTAARVRDTFERRWPAFTRGLMVHHQANDGAQIHTNGTIDPDQVRKLNGDYFPKWEVSPIQDDYLGRFLDLAAAHGAKVVWIMPPYVPELHRLTAESGFDAAWTAYVEGWTARSPGLSVFDARGAVYPVGAFMDPNHLARLGAAVFSRDLGRTLADRVGGRAAERWIVAPDYRPLSGPDRLVDLQESREAARRLAREGAGVGKASR